MTVRLALAGLFGSPNFGNEATLDAFLAQVRSRIAGVEFVCIAPRQSAIERMHGIPLLPIDPWPVAAPFWRLRPAALRQACVDLAERLTEPARRRRAAQSLAGADGLLFPGTGLIDDFGQRPQDLPGHVARWTAAAAAAGLPVRMVAVGVSTVAHPRSRAFFRQALAHTEACSVRDAVSAAQLQRLGHGAAVEIVPDLAFSLPPAALPPAVRRPRPGPIVVGVGVMGYYGWNRSERDGERIHADYFAKLRRLVERLLADGHDVRLFNGDARADPATQQRLAQACAHVGPGRLIVDACERYQDVLLQLAQCDLVVASRFHNVLLALMLERPTLSLGYGDKNDALMQQFGLADRSHDIERFEVDAVLAQIETLLAAGAAATAGLQPQLVDARQRLDSHYDALCARWVRAPGTDA